MPCRGEFLLVAEGVIRAHNMPQDSFTADLTIGLGHKVVSSDRREPNPPAKMTAFMFNLSGIQDHRALTLIIC